MDDDSDRSSEATQFEIVTRDRNRHGQNDDVQQDSASEFDDDDATLDQDSDLETSPMEIQENSTSFRSETLASGLAEVPVQYEVQDHELERLKNQLQGSHQQALAIVIAKAAEAQTGNPIQTLGVPSSTSELSPTISSLPRLSSRTDITSTGDQNINSNSKPVSTSRTVKTPIDGYNWRKYGQKQVKSPKGSRSYFKCTYNNCDAKKIEACDQYSSVTKIIYKGQHKHEPPKKVYTRRGKGLSVNSIVQERKMVAAPGSKEPKSSSSVSNAMILVEEVDAPPPKPKVKKNVSASPGTIPKPQKKPKFVIHAASDVGISADGYRWRKYGQKMVKGTPQPRNYYKCTSAGCPVRKHIELAADGSSEAILTYKGIHDHDMPMPAKDQASPTVLRLTAVASPSKNNSQSNKGESGPSNVIKITT
ncbi:putative transcription factor WRKY family [Helianthus annuus]|nr:putative transcription factor WRKY family [Helianthus annuus]KAJ0710319.1 putative transcription factor WRKY family [Helianthus annuus]